jgi:hypothetical protein
MLTDFFTGSFPETIDFPVGIWREHQPIDNADLVGEIRVKTIELQLDHRVMSFLGLFFAGVYAMEIVGAIRKNWTGKTLFIFRHNN